MEKRWFKVLKGEKIQFLVKMNGMADDCFVSVEAIGVENLIRVDFYPSEEPGSPTPYQLLEMIDLEYLNIKVLGAGMTYEAVVLQSIEVYKNNLKASQN